MPTASTIPVSLRWQGDAAGQLELVDQTLLPARVEWLACRDVDTVVEAIKSLRVRGAPAIGIAGGYGLVVAAGEAARAGMDAAQGRAHILARAEELATARPTAVNLRWAVERCTAVLDRLPDEAVVATMAAALLAEARAIHEEDARLCAAIGRHGAAILPHGGVLTHCNTGALATGGAGTALAVITTAWDDGRRFEVFADETRPLFQGARLTAWELVQRGIPVTVLCDSAAGHLLKTGRVAACIVGADRITACGDTANKIGTYAHAISAKHHGVKVMVVAPSSTVDMATKHGDDIEIELRDARELLFAGGQRVVAEGVAAWNPVFDVTPGPLIDVIVTEKGVIERPDEAAMRAVFGAA
jgi:methylthioribose-1-phosphate isomerase